MLHSTDPELGQLLPARLCELPQACDYDRDNPYIFTGYRARPWHSSARNCMLSVLQLHNETGNIWTHLLALTAACLLHTRALVSPQLLLHPNISWGSVVTINAFCIGAEVCFLFSTTYHTFKCQSGKLYLALLQLDQLGIILLVVCSFLPGLQLGFFCHQHLAYTYMSIVSLALVVGLILILLQIRYPYSSRLQQVTQLFFVLTAGFGLVPGTHFVAVHGVYSQEASYIHYLIAMFGFFAVGFAVFRFKFPESVWPGRFDLWVSSHQIWHILIALGAYCWYLGLTRFLQFRLGGPVSCSLDRGHVS